MKPTIWFDMTNTPQVHFLTAIHRMLSHDYQSLFSSRDFSETTKLLESYVGSHYHLIGGYKGKSKLKKAVGLFSRFTQVFKVKPFFDISISCGSENAIWYSFLKGKKSIAFGDNDLAKQWTYSRFVDFSFFPKAIPTEILTRQGIKKNELYQYNGYKENIYLADFIPDKNFYSKIPFEHFIVIRAENLQANYIKKNNTQSLVPQLIKLLVDKGINIVYLPRYQSDKDLVTKNDKLFIPPEPLNGLDLVYYSNAVLTGAGTLAREAACLNTPAVSFFSGNRLLAVDKELIQKNKMFYSRNPEEILKYVMNSNKSEPDINASKPVRDDVKNKLSDVLKKLL